MEVYVLIEKKKSMIAKVFAIVSYLLGAGSLFLTIVGGLLFFIVAVVLFVLGWFLHRGCLEYEYSYFDGEFRFARILNKSRRKELKWYSADEVVLIAPIEDRAAHSYVNNTKLKVLDYTSGNSDAKVYVMVAKDEADVKLIKYEPDEAYLDEVCIKYKQKVVR